MKRLHILYWIITIGVFLLGLILVLALSPPANASGCEHGCTPPPTTTYIVDKDDNGLESALKAIGISAAVACRVRAGYVGWTENRWWTWCGEGEKKKEPLPSPGPAPRSEIVPEISGARLYQ